MNPCLVILNPRHIEECIASYEALDIDRVYLTGYTEPQLEEAMNQVPEEYTHRIVTADDTIVSQKALDAVCGLLSEGFPVATGYCPLDHRSHLVNITKSPLPSPIPSVVSYEFYARIEVQTFPYRVIPTFFAGMALTGMSRELWTQFPMTVSPLGLQTDYSLSYRLQEAGIPIVAHRDAYIDHVKERWNTADQEERKRLLIGEIEPEVRVVRGRMALSQQS